jgi:hypothetical protein
VGQQITEISQQVAVTTRFSSMNATISLVSSFSCFAVRSEYQCYPVVRSDRSTGKPRLRFCALCDLSVSVAPHSRSYLRSARKVFLLLSSCICLPCVCMYVCVCVGVCWGVPKLSEGDVAMRHGKEQFTYREVIPREESNKTRCLFLKTGVSSVVLATMPSALSRLLFCCLNTVDMIKV